MEHFLDRAVAVAVVPQGIRLRRWVVDSDMVVEHDSRHKPFPDRNCCPAMRPAHYDASMNERIGLVAG